MSNIVTYTFYLDNVGAPVIGATPTFETFLDIDASSLAGSSVEVGAAQQATVSINELQDGFYYFDFDWGLTSGFSGKSYLVKINCGDENIFADPKQRFIIMKLDRSSNVQNVVERIETASTSITTATTSLLSRINRLLEIEQGSWKIEEENGLYVLNLYPTKNNAENAPRYETTLDITQPIAKYYLQDESGVSSATNPYRRLQIAGNSILPIT
jgi:hypothetical protein